MKLFIKVLNECFESIHENVTFYIKREGEQEFVLLESIYFPSRQLYKIDGLMEGYCHVKVICKDYQSVEREIRLPVHEDLVFSLIKEGMSYYYCGDTKVPFIPTPNQIAFVVPFETIDDEGKLSDLMESLKQFKLRVTDKVEIEQDEVWYCEFGRRSRLNDMVKSCSNLVEREDVGVVFPIVKYFNKDKALLGQNAKVRFNLDLSHEDILKLAAKSKVTIDGAVSKHNNLYVISVDFPDLNQHLLNVGNQFINNGLAVSFTPVITRLNGIDSIIPNDYLFPLQWDHHLVNMPDVWQFLHDELDPGRKFGDPNIVVAVVDSGIEATHPDFDCQLSDGTDKIAGLFDFHAMAPGNATEYKSWHGIKCAGTISARTDDGFGTAGIAGNTKLIGIVRNGPSDYFPRNVHYTVHDEMYEWIAGLHLDLAYHNFPAQISGADIISSSYGGGF